MINKLMQKISMLFSTRKARFFFVLAIFFYMILIIVRLLEAFFREVIYLPFQSVFFEFINLTKEVLFAFALLLTIYGLVLKIPNIKSFLKIKPTTNITNKYSKDLMSQEDKGDEILNSYYLQALQQSNINFLVSVIAASLGFLVIIYSLFVDNPNQPVITSDPTSNPGSPNSRSDTIKIPKNSNQNSEIWARVVQTIVLESVAALFFVQTNKTRKTMVDFSDKLRSDRNLDRNLTEALELIEKIPNKSIQSKVKALLVLKFSGLEMNYKDQEVLKQIIEAKATEQATKSNGISNQVNEE